jgi:hypothetical protein
VSNADQNPSKINNGLERSGCYAQYRHGGEESGERSRKVERQRPFDSSAASAARPTTATAPTFSSRRASNGRAVQPKGRIFGGLDMAPLIFIASAEPGPFQQAMDEDEQLSVLSVLSVIF